MKLLHIIVLVFISTLGQTFGQEITLKYQNHHVLPSENIDGHKLGGLSGITFNPVSRQLIAVADKNPARLLKISYLNSSDEVGNLEYQKLAPPYLELSELEGIAFNQVDSGYYVSDEQGSGTRILQLDKNANFKKVVYPKNQTFLPLSAHNSGIEGLALSEDNNRLFFAFERPTSSCSDQNITTIGSIDLVTSAVKTYGYELHKVLDDELNTNGISEILYLSDSTLLIMERAYIPGKGNIVRLYETKLDNSIMSESPIECDGNGIQTLASTLVFDFADVDNINIDNAEGMCFNEDKSLLFIITDDNFSGKQETQLVIMNVRWL